MQNILQTLDTLTNDELEVIIDRAEAILQERLAQVPLREDPAIGMWADQRHVIAPHGFANYVRADGLAVVDTDILIDALRGFGPGLNYIEDAK